MPKSQISIKLDSELLDRIDELAEDIGSTRTALIESMINTELPEREAFHRSLENPVVRAVHQQISRPAIIKAISVLVDRKLTDDDISALIENAPVHREAGKRRQERKKQGKRARPEGA